MAVTKPDVEWFYHPDSFQQYGVLCLAKKWAVIMQPDQGDFVVMTDWFDDRKTAIGFLKLLKES